MKTTKTGILFLSIIQFSFDSDLLTFIYPYKTTQFYYRNPSFQVYSEPFNEFVAEKCSFKLNFNKWEVMKLSSKNKTVQISVIEMSKTVILFCFSFNCSIFICLHSNTLSIFLTLYFIKTNLINFIAEIQVFNCSSCEFTAERCSFELNFNKWGVMNWSSNSNIFQNYIQDFFLTLSYLLTLYFIKPIKFNAKNQVTNL